MLDRTKRVLDECSRSRPFNAIAAASGGRAS
jgi:hypothetical protein